MDAALKERDGCLIEESRSYLISCLVFRHLFSPGPHPSPVLYSKSHIMIHDISSLRRTENIMSHRTNHQVL